MDEVFVALNMGLTFLVTQGIKVLGLKLGIKIEKWGSILTAAIVGSLLFFLKSLASGLTPEAQQIIVTAFGLVSLVLGSYGIHYTLRGAPQVAK